MFIFIIIVLIFTIVACSVLAVGARRDPDAEIVVVIIGALAVIICAVALGCVIMMRYYEGVEDKQRDIEVLAQYAEYQQLVEDAQHWRDFSETLDIIADKVYEAECGEE